MAKKGVGGKMLIGRRAGHLYPRAFNIWRIRKMKLSGNIT